MTNIRKFIIVAPVAAMMIAGGARVVRAQDHSHDTVRDKNLEMGEAEAKRLLTLMDRDQNGKVSKKEFMTFMEEEFNLLDKNKDGELDVKELLQNRFTPHGGGRGK